MKCQRNVMKSSLSEGGEFRLTAELLHSLKGKTHLTMVIRKSGATSPGTRGDR